jgi:hypothetical protein
MIVVAEVALLPLVFGDVAIAIAWSVANALLLALRIHIENAALAGCDDGGHVAAQDLLIGSLPMETASISQLRDREKRLHPVFLASLKRTPSPVGRVDSREPRGVLRWSAWQAGQRSSPPARLAGPLPLLLQLTENSHSRAANRWGAGCQRHTSRHPSLD